MASKGIKLITSRRNLIACIECGDEWGTLHSIENFICPPCKTPKTWDDIEIYEYNIECLRVQQELQRNEIKWHRERYETTHSDARWAGVVEKIKDVLDEYSNSYNEAVFKMIDIIAFRVELEAEIKLLKPISLWREDNVKVA